MINWNSFACFTILLLCLWIRQPPSTEQKLLWDYAALGGDGGGGVCRVLLGDSVKLVCTNECLCNLSRKKSREVAASFLGQFLSRRCFTLCITMEVEPRIAKQYKCHHRCSCKNYRGKGMEGEKKSVFGGPEDHEFMEKMRFGASYSTSNKLLLIARHSMTTGLQKCL